MPEDITKLKFKTFLDKPSVTVYIDGLIMIFHDEAINLTRAAIHTKAEHHSLRIVVRNRANDKELFRWEVSHGELKSIEPLWLFVAPAPDSPPPKSGFNATQELDGERSFSHVLDFERTLYDHALDRLNPSRFAVLNMPHGVFYSAATEVSKLISFEQDQNLGNAKEVTNITTCTFGAADINARSAPGDAKYIALRAMRHSPQELFNFPLEADTHYNVYVLNVPIDSHTRTSPEEHFLQYYELFTLRPREKKFTVAPKDGSLKAELMTPLSPPCNISQGSTTPRPGG